MVSSHHLPRKMFPYPLHDSPNPSSGLPLQAFPQPQPLPPRSFQDTCPLSVPRRKKPFVGHLCSAEGAASSRCCSTRISPLPRVLGTSRKHWSRGKCREAPFLSSGCDLCTHINLGWARLREGWGGGAGRGIGEPEGRERKREGGGDGPGRSQRNNVVERGGEMVKNG